MEVFKDSLSESVQDNRFLSDNDGAAQKLTHAAIEALKDKGETGMAILGKVIANSATFTSKTQFSQEKYIKAKSKKYSNKVSIERPTTRLLCEMLFQKGPQKICNLRADSLAGILLKANVRPGARVMVAETCQGLVAGAVLDRVGAGDGTVVYLHHGDMPNNTVVNHYNFAPDVMDNLWSYPMYGIKTVCEAAGLDTRAIFPADEDADADAAAPTATATATATAAAEDAPAAAVAVKAEPGTTDADADTGAGGGGGQAVSASTASTPAASTGAAESRSLPTAEAGTAAPMDTGAAAGPGPDTTDVTDEVAAERRKQLDEREAKREMKRALLRRSHNLLAEAKMDALVVVVRHNPLTFVKALIPLLAPSRPFVIFSMHKVKASSALH